MSKTDKMFKNIEVYGLEDSVRTSGFPMSAKSKIEEIPDDDGRAYVVTSKDVGRALKLSHASSGAGHDCFLKGVIVQADVTAPQYWWLQFGRYHFADIISSQSKMHCITKFDIKQQCNSFVSPRIVEFIENMVKAYKDGDITLQKLLSNVPMGLMLTARITTNYLQLKTMYSQRKLHRLPEWHNDFVDFVKHLPYQEMITGEKN